MLSDNLKARFGCKVYKLSLDGGMGCPGRCIFCADGSGAFSEQGGSVTEQIERAKVRVAAKVKSGSYIAYFQKNTNTYAPAERLRALFSEALSHPDVVMLSVATRPDCLEPEKVELLRELNKIKPVSVELGLQTVHEDTARYIRRGYDTAVYDDAVSRLHAAGLEVVTHVILFLPGETEQMMLETVRHVARVRSDGIKLQLLHVLQGTDLARERVTLPSLAEYTDMLEKCVTALPRDMVIHRLTGDGDKKKLIAPLWSGDKKRVLNYVHAAFARHNVEQGSLYNPID